MSSVRLPAGKTFATNLTFIDPVINPKDPGSFATGGDCERSGLPAGNKGTPETGATAKLTVPRLAVLWTGVRSVVYVKLAEGEIPLFSVSGGGIGRCSRQAMW
ncbi:MAG: hypothetical protein R2788_12695 [Saprospiraceae bacterium]